MADDRGHEADKVDAEYPHSELRRMLRDSYKGQRWWSCGNGTLTVVIIAFSAIAATLAQVGNLKLAHFDLNGSELASIFSIVVTIASTVQTKMGFERKWAANRATQSALRQLRIDEAAGLGAKEMGDALKKIISTHDHSIIGARM